MTWTEDQARALITDPGTLKRGQELAAPAKWQHLGQTATAAWGECKGSGSKPYQTGIDLTEPAFKCSCPSRVFPCKHGAGLLLLLARQPQLLSSPTPPPWLHEWLEKRQQTQEKKVVKAAEATENESPGSPLSTGEGGRGGEASLNDATRQKREAQRQTRMQRGAQELETWLVDLVRAGLAATDQQPPAYWETQAARLVDNQLPGLAAVVRELPALRHQGADWPARMLARLGELYLLVRAFQRLPELPEDARQEVLQQVGVTLKKEDVQATRPAVADEWRVLDLTTTEEERLTVRRAWLRGQHTGRFALVVEFSFGGQPFTPLVPDGRYAGELTFYPGLLPLRAIPGQLTFQGVTPGNPVPAGGSGPAQLLTDYADALAHLPWLREWPALLTGGVPTPAAEGWVLRFPADAAGLSASASSNEKTTDIRLLCDDLFGWELRAISGGAPLTVFGEWTGQGLRPLVGWDAVVELQTA